MFMISFRFHDQLQRRAPAGWSLAKRGLSIFSPSSAAAISAAICSFSRIVISRERIAQSRDFAIGIGVCHWPASVTRLQKAVRFALVGG